MDPRQTVPIPKELAYCVTLLEQIDLLENNVTCFSSTLALFATAAEDPTPRLVLLLYSRCFKSEAWSYQSSSLLRGLTSVALSNLRLLRVLLYKSAGLLRF